MNNQGNRSETLDCLQSALNDLLSVFVLLDCTDYEGCVVLRAFKLEESAEALKAMAEAHDAKKPQCPSCTDDSDECNKEWDIYEESLKQWKKSHPIKEGFDGADFYSISEVPFSGL